jgi:transcriptional regulator with PAS, ATPase and Fis domain
MEKAFACRRLLCLKSIHTHALSNQKVEPTVLNIFARKLIEDLIYPGAVLGPAGEVIEINEAFKAGFYENNHGANPSLAPDFRAALEKAGAWTADGASPAETIIDRQGKHFRVDVYFLDKQSGQGGLRLVIALPIEADRAADTDPNDPPSAAPALSPEFAALIGKDPGFVQALTLAQRAAQTDLPVLILGESGTGKEILARTIHMAGRRHKKPFVDMNCAAVPDSLVESELFGYEKGAFTGASAKGKAGYFESAHQGTIFMDEIGDAAPQTQAKLLRVLESGQFKRIGSNRNISADVRLIAATNQELSHRIAEGRFRADLLYRINTISIRLPPLRRRIGDLSLLADHFLRTAAGASKKAPRFSKEAMELLHAYDWPGNVRELKGVIDYAVTMNTGKILTPRSFPGFLRAGSAPCVTPVSHASPPTPPLEDPQPETDSLVTIVERTEKLHIQKILAASKNRSEAIRRLAISRRTFYSKIKQYGLG